MQEELVQWHAGSPVGPEPDRETLLTMLKKMCLTRFFEETAFQQYALGKVHGTMHLYEGEEAVAVGAITALEPDDYIVSTHRGHGHAISKGQDIQLMMAELLGKETGVCRGRGGSMHMADLTLGNLGANGVVSGGIPLSVGAGLAVHLQQSGKVVLSFFGDGASNEGNFHESLNLAAVWKLPIVFICENNQYGMSMSAKRSVGGGSIADRAAAYGMPGQKVDGMDVLAVHKTARSAIAHVRSGAGPVLLEMLTYRYLGHSKSDRQLYRTKEEVAEWKRRDPIVNFRARLVADGLLSEAEADGIEAEAQKAIDEAVAFAEAAPEPSLAHLTDDVYFEDPEVQARPEQTLPAWIRDTFGPATRINPEPGTREISYSEALREAMSQALACDSRVYALGEDIGIYGGAFGVTQGWLIASARSVYGIPRYRRIASLGRRSARLSRACARWLRSSSWISLRLAWSSWCCRVPRSAICSAGRLLCL